MPDADGGKRQPTGLSGHREERKLPFRYPREVCTLRLRARKVGRPRGLSGVTREVEEDNSMRQTREVREEQFLARSSKKEDT